MRLGASVLKVVALAIVVIAAAGCAELTGISEFKRDLDWLGPLPAAVLFDELKLALSSHTPPLPLEISLPGQLETAWISVPGKQTGILWWRRQWEARVRHTIRVRPDFFDPLKRSGFVVISRAEQRPNPNYPWQQADDDFAENASQSLRANLRRLADTITGRERAPR